MKGLKVRGYSSSGDGNNTENKDRRSIKSTKEMSEICKKSFLCKEIDIGDSYFNNNIGENIQENLDKMNINKN